MNSDNPAPASSPAALPVHNHRLWAIATGLPLGVAILVAAIVAGQSPKARVLNDSELRANGAYMFDSPQALPPFSLLDHHGQVFDPSRLQGRWTLVFFGFTHCPDICPTTMADLANMMKKLEDLPEADTQVVLVTVDPERDDIKRLSDYVSLFNPGFTGVTGEPAALKDFASALNTLYRKVPGLDSDDYQIDHSANVSLIDPQGGYRGFFSSPLNPDRLKLAYRSIRRVWEGNRS